jgi:XTP/dITP diphosphohydrolase
MRIVLATRNRDKITEIRRILHGLDVDLSTIDDYPDAPETVEDGDTLEENALKKAREMRAHTGRSALADDTGLEVDALGGAPGIHAARYAGEYAGYEANCRKLLGELEDVADADRTARFRTVMALALGPEDADRLQKILGEKQDAGGAQRLVNNEVDALVTEGILSGSITREWRGRGGFGYDPLFLELASGKTLAEMTADEKNAVSHRYRALVEMRELLLRLELAVESR